MSVILDASITLPWFFDDEATPACDELLERVTSGGAVVPSLWRLEIANVLRNGVRRGRCSVEQADGFLTRLSQLSIRIDEETDRHAWGQINSLSRRHDLTPYDAAYLELAIRLQLPLATCDVRLAAAAQMVGLLVLTS